MENNNACIDPMCRKVEPAAKRILCHFLVATVKVIIAVAVGIVGGGTVGVILQRGINLTQIIVLAVTALVAVIAVKFVFRR